MFGNCEQQDLIDIPMRLQHIICHEKEFLSSPSFMKLVLIRNRCYQCKLVCTGTMNEWCKILTIKTIGGHKSVNRLSVNNEANFFINSLIR